MDNNELAESRQMGWDTGMTSELMLPDEITAEIAKAWFNGFEAYLAEYAPMEDIEDYDEILGVIWDEREMHKTADGKPDFYAALNAVKQKLVKE